MKRFASRRGRWPGAMRLLAVLSICCASAVRADAPASTEYKVKAGFIFNFTQFVEWPTGRFETASAPVEIGVLGENPFGSALDEAVSGQTVHGRPLVVRPATRNIADLKSCHIIFVCRSEKPRLKEVRDGLKGSQALTVGDHDDFAARGGMINLVMKGTKVRFEINNHAAKREDIKISSQLLDLGTQVDEKETK